MRKIQHGQWRPYLLMDRNKLGHAQLDHQGNIPEKLKKNLLWSLMRCNNEIVTVLSKGEVAISKTVAIFVDGPEPNSGLHN